MRYGALAENPIERVVLTAGLLPTPLLDVHAAMSGDDWGLYQRGMRAQATFAVPEVARRTPVPRGARDMLDIGGSHGYFSVALCRRHAGLRATVLDLPAAVAHAAPLLA